MTPGLLMAVCPVTWLEQGRASDSCLLCSLLAVPLLPLSQGVKALGPRGHPREGPHSPLVRPGCRGTGVELEGAAVMAEAEQVREPSSDGQDFAAGSVEASVRSRLPPCGDPRFGFRSPGP